MKGFLRSKLILTLVALILLAGATLIPFQGSHAPVAHAATATVTDIPNPDNYTCAQSGYIDFETMSDGTNLSPSAINGVQFSTTNGYTWLVGDFATGNYNGKYPSGGYTSQGTHWAWLGPNQGAGRIDFVNGSASVVSLLVADYTPVQLDAYNAADTLLATAGPAPSNYNTGHMSELKITRDTADIAYVIVHDSGNYFLVDSICTNASGVPYQAPLNITVSTPGGHFISSYIQDNAALPLHIHVTYSDGSPVVGASVRLSNPNGFLAVFSPITDSNGNLDAPLPLPPSPLSPQPLTEGDFVSEVIATVNGKDYSSGPLTLYHADLVGTRSGTTTQAEADNYSWNLLNYYATRPGLPCPGINLSVKGICYALKVIDMYAKEAQANTAYSPKAGDSWTIQVYKYSAPMMTPVYLYYESNDRSGSNIYKYAKWTEDISQVQPFLNQQAMIRTALVAKFASPVTVLAVSPTGQRAGFDPITHKYVFDFPAAVSNADDEPYELVIPSPVQGQYTYQVTGTGNGTYTMTVQNLDSAGNGNPVTTISGVAAPGITDTYVLTYPASAGQPVVVVRKIAIDIKPGEDPPAINPTSIGVIPVAILSTPTFDARKVSLSSVRFGSANAPTVDKQLDIEDVNGDGRPDVVFHFVIKQTGIKAGDTQACLNGQTTSSVNITGCDVIRTVTS